MNALNKIFCTDLGKIFTGNIVVQVTTVLQAIIVSRLLGPEGKGHFIEIILWPTIIAGFSILGLYTGIVRLCADDNIFHKWNVPLTTLRATLIVGSLGSIVSLIATPYLISNNNHQLTNCAIVFSSFVLINNIARGFNAIDHGRKDYTTYSVTRSILNPIFFAELIILYYLDKLTVETTVYAFLIANLIVAFIRVIVTFKKVGSSRAPFPLKSLFESSLKYAPSDLSEPLYAYYDKAIIAMVLTSYELGIYTTAYSATSLINILSNVFGTKLFSDVATKQETKSIYICLRQNIILMTLGGIFLIPILPFMIPIIFSTSFNDAVFPSILLVLTCIIQGISFIIERGVLALGYPYMGIKAKTVSMILFGVLAFVLKFTSFINIYSIIIIITICQLIYFIYIAKQLSTIGKRERILPNYSDVTLLLRRFIK